MPGEHTPLLTTVQVGRPRRRYPHNVLRRFCTIALSSIIIWFLLSVFVAIAVHPIPPNYPGHHHHDHDRWRWPGSRGRTLSYEQLKEILIETPSSEKAEEWSRYYTAGPHLAGQNYSQVRDTNNTPFFVLIQLLIPSSRPYGLKKNGRNSG